MAAHVLHKQPTSLQSMAQAWSIIWPAYRLAKWGASAGLLTKSVLGDLNYVQVACHVAESKTVSSLKVSSWPITKKCWFAHSTSCVPDVEARCLLMQERCRAKKSLMVEFELMARSEYFVGSSTSGFFYFVSVMRAVLYQKPYVTAVDVRYPPWEYGPAIRNWFGWGFHNTTVARHEHLPQ